MNLTEHIENLIDAAPTRTGSEAWTYCLHLGDGLHYIGSTARPRARLGKHLRSLLRGNHESSCVQEAFNSLQNPSLSVEWSECDSREDAYEAEQEWLYLDYDLPGNLNSKLEVLPGPEWTDERRERQSEALKNSEKARAWHESRRGIPHSQETCEKIAEAQRGVPRSPEAVAKDAAAKRVYTYSVTLDSGAVEEHPSTSALARALGVNKSTVRDWLDRENASPKMLSLGIAAITREPFDRSEEVA